MNEEENNEIVLYLLAVLLVAVLPRSQQNAVRIGESHLFLLRLLRWSYRHEREIRERIRVFELYWCEWRLRIPADFKWIGFYDLSRRMGRVL